MEKSIESIWKEGFLSKDALVAPKLNNLYSEKSKDTVAKFKRMGKINLYAIVIGALIVWLISLLIQSAIAGTIIFGMLLFLVWVGKKRAEELEKIEPEMNSYLYLKSFTEWLKKSHSIYGKIYRFFYPIFFLTITLGLLYSGVGDFNNGQMLQEFFQDSDAYKIMGVPVLWVLISFFALVILSIFGERLYQLDAKMVYGRILNRLEEMLHEMEELRN